VAADPRSEVHRILKVQPRLLEGEDVKHFQRALNYLAGHRHLPVVDVDGQFGPMSYELAVDVAWLIGLHDRHVKGPVSQYTQKRVRHPDDRTKPELDRATTRWHAWEEHMTESERAYRVAESLVGVMEQGGNNTGPMVDKIIHENSGAIGEPWCGDTMAYCYRHAGSKYVTRSWASVRLLRGLAGLEATNHPVRGDLVRYTFDHVGMFVKDNGNGTITTIEGNTGPSGAVSDGNGNDGVYIKIRGKDLVRDYLHVKG
jgi:hypothetical protein